MYSTSHILPISRENFDGDKYLWYEMAHEGETEWYWVYGSKIFGYGDETKKTVA